MWTEIFKWNLRDRIYGDGKPLTCSGCEDMLRGGFCLPCDLKAENSFICDQDAYSFNDPSNNFNYLPQSQYENYLCNLCGNNSHDGYDCQQQFSFVYEQEPSYNQNYDGNYYSHDLPSFPCVITMGDLMKLSSVNRWPKILIFPVLTKFKPHSILMFILRLKKQDSNELFQKLLEDLKELAEYKESLDNSSKEIAISSSNPEKEEPPQDSDIHQLIEECSTQICEEHRQSMEDTMLELVKICQEKELLCIHDNVEDLIESAPNTKLLSINS
nr:hypothetical protein [Tanacetum cinerariifolium]